MVVDLLFNSGRLFLYLKDVHEWFVAFPGYVILILVYFYYRYSSFASEQELSSKSGMWQGVVIMILSIVVAVIVSI